MGRKPGRSKAGKLEGAARHWLSGAGETDELQQSAAGWGLELPAELTEPEHFEVWPANWPAVRLFIRCQTQWRVSDGQRIGLDYGALLAMGSLFSVENLSQVVEDVQVIEAEILSHGAKG